MAESDIQTDQINREEEFTKGQQTRRLKYLDVVHVAVIQTLLCFSRFYDFSKENSGPLKPGVQTVEGVAKAVVGPVYEKFHGIPFVVLTFLDDKVELMIGEIERHVPSLMKETSSRVYSVTWSNTGEFQRAGLSGIATGLARSVYTKSETTAKKLYGEYEPVAEQYAVTAWLSLNRLPVFPQVAQIVVPTAAYWSDKYNKAVIYAADRGYAASAYLPLVPTERIAKVFGESGEPVALVSE